MAEQVKLQEMSTLSVGKIVETLSQSYVKLIKNNVPLNKFPSVMLWGQPGVGKSEAIEQICRNISEETGKKAVKTDVRLLLFNPIDLRGIPVPDVDKDGDKVAKWLKPLIFKMDPNKDVVNVLLLDELSSAPQSVQAAAYQITLDKKVGEHELPSNCIVIAAGNRLSDKSVSYKMPKALSNRLLHFEVSSDFESWKYWAIRNDVNPIILGFLSFRPNLLNTFDSSSEALAYATPRSWVMVSNLLNYIDDNVNRLYPQIAGLVGTSIAMELVSWSKIYKFLPKIEDIFDGKNVEVPKNSSAVFAVSCSMIQFVKNHKTEINRIANSIKYAAKFPKDFSILLIKEYLAIDKDLRKKLLLIPEFNRWLSANSVLLNGQFNGLFK